MMMEAYLQGKTFIAGWAELYPLPTSSLDQWLH